MSINPAVVSANTNSGSFTTGTSVTVSSTGSVTAGMLMVVIVSPGAASAPTAISAPDGTWTTFLATTNNASAAATASSAIFYKKATSTGSFSGSFSWTTTATRGSWGFFVLRGTGLALVDGTVASTQNASGTKTSPSVTPGAGNTQDTLIGYQAGNAAATNTITQPSGMTSVLNINGTTTQHFFSIASLALTSASATGAKTWTNSANQTNLGASFLILQEAPWDFETVGVTISGFPPPQSLIRSKRAGIRGRSGFPVWSTWVNSGTEVQSFQPPHPRPERGSGAIAAISNVEAVYVPPTPPAVVPSGWESVLHQPSAKPLRFPAAVMRGDDGAENTQILWVNGGQQIQAFQPSHPRYRNLDRGDDGTEGPFVQWFNSGSEVQPFQPGHPRPERTAATMPLSNIEGRFINFYPSGFEVQPYQPQHLRFKDLDRGDDGIEQQFISFYPTGFEIQPPQPPHPRPERSAGIMPWLNIEAVFVPPPPAVVPYGWETQSYQPQHVRFERIAAIMPIVNVETTLTQFRPSGFEVQPPQPPHPRPERWAAVAPSSPVESVFVPPPVTTVFVGYEFQSPALRRFPTVNQRYAGIKGRVEFGIFSQFYPFGWEVQPPPPPHPRPERSGAIMPWLNIESVYVPPTPTVVSYGWENASYQPQHVRKERAGAIMPIVNVEVTFTSFRPAGFEVQSPQPPHPRSERSGSIMTWGNVEAVYVPPVIQAVAVGYEFQPIQYRAKRTYSALEGRADFAVPLQFYPMGWDLASPLPPHPRPEKWGGIAPWSNVEAVFVPPPPSVVPAGWEQQAYQPQHIRWERWAAAVPISNIEIPSITFYPSGFDPQPFQPPRLRWERRGGILPISNIESVFAAWVNQGWEIASHQPGHPRPEKAGSVMPVANIEAVFAPFSFAGFEFQSPVLRSFPTAKQRYAGIKGRVEFGILFQSYPFGWEIQSFQPNHPTLPFRSGAFAGLSNVEIVYVFVPLAPPPAMWEVALPIVVHPRPERAAAFLDNATLTVYNPMPPPTTNFMFRPLMGVGI
jgi:hypothetical protein